MKRKEIYLGIACIALIAIAITCMIVLKKRFDSPAEITWLPASALPKTWSNGRDFTWYSLQGNMIYCMGSPFSEADVATFLVSSLGAYAKDKNHAYWCAQEIAIADPATFTVVNDIYAKDDSHVFYGGYYLVPGADPATFSIVPSPQPFDSGYAKDKDHVYSLYRELPDADPATFMILYPLIPRDKNWIYSGTDVIGPASLITDNTEYAKALPAQCNPAGSYPINPQPYPPAFSADGSVIGYTNADSICVIDKKAHTIQVFPYGFAEEASLSKDGSYVLFFKSQKGDGEGEPSTCADCGEYSIDRATGKIQRVVVSGTDT